MQLVGFLFFTPLESSSGGPQFRGTAHVLGFRASFQGVYHVPFEEGSNSPKGWLKRLQGTTLAEVMWVFVGRRASSKRTHVSLI